LRSGRNRQQVSLFLSLYFLETLLETYFEYCDREIRHINDKLTAVEKEILDHHTPDNVLVVKLAILKRDILSFRRIASLNRNILDSLKIMGTTFYGKESELYLDTLANDSFKLNNTIEGFSDIINSLESTFNTLVSTEVNRLTRAYTYISLFTWPALLVFSIYQTNSRDLPLVDLPFSWAYILSLGAALSVIVFTILKKKNII